VGPAPGWRVAPLGGLGLWYFARAKALSVRLSNAYFESLGLPSFIDEDRYQLSNRCVRTRMHAGLAMGRLPH
jgi:hypothetical protein